MISPTISQCSTCETAPQRSVVFRRPMRAKLMRVNSACKLRALDAALPALLLGGCPLPPRAPAPPPVAAAPQAEAEKPAPHEGPEAARQGTLRNMLGAALLDGEHHHEIVLRTLRLEPAAAAAGDAGAAGGMVLARVQTTVRGEVRAITIPVSYRLTDGTVTASGEARLRQSELGLTPFSAMLGALQVQDEMRISFRVCARRVQSVQSELRK